MLKVCKDLAWSDCFGACCRFMCWNEFLYPYRPYWVRQKKCFYRAFSCKRIFSAYSHRVRHCFKSLMANCKSEFKEFLRATDNKNCKWVFQCRIIGYIPFFQLQNCLSFILFNKFTTIFLFIFRIELKWAINFQMKKIVLIFNLYFNFYWDTIHKP